MNWAEKSDTKKTAFKDDLINHRHKYAVLIGSMHRYIRYIYINVSSWSILYRVISILVDQGDGNKWILEVVSFPIQVERRLRQKLSLCDKFYAHNFPSQKIWQTIIVSNWNELKMEVVHPCTKAAQPLINSQHPSIIVCWSKYRIRYGNPCK